MTTSDEAILEIIEILRRSDTQPHPAWPDDEMKIYEDAEALRKLRAKKIAIIVRKLVAEDLEKEAQRDYSRATKHVLLMAARIALPLDIRIERWVST